ncbi:MAG: flagellar basal body L-ring protein FlgH [Thermodesulfobacteriota bacterium]
MKKERRVSTAALWVLVIMVAGCSSGPETNAVMPLPESQTPMAGHSYSAQPAAEGSLWTENGGELLFVDRRARRTGDTIIVDIVENTSSKVDANTETKSERTLEVAVDGLTGQENINENLSPSALWKSSLTNEHKGEGQSDRSGRVTASIGGRITEVLPNGNMVVFGKREMRVNNENQIITVSGIARREDVTADNHIKSTYLADARIEYFGEGVLGDKQRVGWGMRIIDWVSPF